MFDQSPPFPSPLAANSVADDVKAVFFETECCDFSISYSWALLAQVCVPG